MTPETKANAQDSTDNIHLQEQGMQYVEDHSRPAQEILEDQRESRTGDEAPALFVP